MATYEEKEIPELGTGYPVGSYHFEFVEAEHSTPEEPLQIKVVLKVIEGPEGVTSGAKYTERFRLGTNDDPQAEQPDTKRDFKKAGASWAHWLDLTKKTGVFCGDTEEEVAALNAARPDIYADMDRREGKKDGKPTGKFYNNLSRFYEAGTAEPSTPAKVAPKAAAPKAAAPAAKPAAKPAGSKMIKCEVCDPPKSIPEKLYSAHAKRHEEELAAEEEE